MTPLNSTPPARAAETTGPPADDRALVPASRLAVWLKTRAAWILLLDIALVVLFTITSPHHVYATTANAKNLLLALTEALLLALGLSMMLGAGIFDLSLGANLVLSSVVGAKVMLLFPASGGSPAPAIIVGLAACLATGLLYGLINGLIIAVIGINSLIATLATLGIGTGIADLLTSGTDLGGLPAQIQTDIGLRSFGVVPLPSVVALAAVVVLWAVVRYTRYGLRVQGIGSSRAAAERAGLRVRAYLISLTVMAGGLAGIAGFIDLTRFGSTTLAGHPERRPQCRHRRRYRRNASGRRLHIDHRHAVGRLPRGHSRDRACDLRRVGVLAADRGRLRPARGGRARPGNRTATRPRPTLNPCHPIP